MRRTSAVLLFIGLTALSWGQDFRGMKWGATKAEVIAFEGTDYKEISSRGDHRLRYTREALGRKGVEVDYFFTIQGALKGGSYSVVNVSDLVIKNLLRQQKPSKLLMQSEAVPAPCSNSYKVIAVWNIIDLTILI